MMETHGLRRVGGGGRDVLEGGEGGEGLKGGGRGVWLGPLPSLGPPLVTDRRPAETC